MKRTPSSIIQSPRKPAVPSRLNSNKPVSAAASVDQTDLLLLEELQQNARVSFSELARRVGLSTPSVIDRVRRLEDAGVLLGYRAQVNAAALGLGIRAFVKVTVAGDRIAAFATLAKSIPEILECHRVTGNESFLAQVAVRDMDHLEQVLDAMMPYVSTNTSIVLNSPVSHASIAPHTGLPPGSDAPRKR
ncbi:Lrp/AsnC family transcriptional regulator [Terriglobus aquaticus]|uniref:Lrp/AsnC family transcriptional regulator n=1 Tax=Terriglobus aquaticus TaxID=940139 RepID=A0ABW9KLX6_9BACT|nr:Lrp/AsnC family transcriptional regulator [Terriglobus aquaticus]